MGRPALTTCQCHSDSGPMAAVGSEPSPFELGSEGVTGEVVCKALGTCPPIPAHLLVLLLEKPPSG